MLVQNVSLDCKFTKETLLKTGIYSKLPYFFSVDLLSISTFCVTYHVDTVLESGQSQD